MGADFSGFLQILTREAELVEEFVRLLEQEKNLLTEGHTERLTELAGEKERLAAELNGLTQRRGQALAGQGFSPDRDGMASWSAMHPEQTEAITAWERTLNKAARAQELNRLNGQLIQMHMQFTGQALEVLQRKESRLDLYGPDGRSTPSGKQSINDTV